MIVNGRVVRPVKWNRIILPSRVDTTCYAFSLVPEVVDGVIPFIEIGSVEMVLNGWVIGTIPWNEVQELVDRGRGLCSCSERIGEWKSDSDCCGSYKNK